MLLIDSNIIIYASKPEYENLRVYLKVNEKELAASAISMIETLNYQLPSSQKRYIEKLYESIEILPVTSEIILKAKQLQENKKLKGADSIIAATAIKHKAILLTNNISDFKKINNIKIISPIKTEPG